MQQSVKDMTEADWAVVVQLPVTVRYRSVDSEVVRVRGLEGRKRKPYKRRAPVPGKVQRLLKYAAVNNGRAWKWVSGKDLSAHLAAGWARGRGGLPKAED